MRISVKVPTASTDDGLGTGKTDFQFDLIGSKEYNQKVELTASAGYKVRGQPDGYNLTQGFKWGIGAAYPSRSKFRMIAEMHGEALQDQEQTYTGPSLAAIGMPREWDPDATRDLFGGFQYSTDKGLYFGLGLGYTASYYLHRSDFTHVGRQRLRPPGHPGPDRLLPRRPRLVPLRFSRRATAAAAMPAEPAAHGEGTLRTLHGRSGRQLTASADAQDPDGDTLRYRWSSPTGSFGNAGDRQTPWTAPGQVGAVPLTVTVDDGKGMTATDTITVQVIAPAREEAVHVRGRALRLRPLHAARRSDAHPRRSHQGDERRPDAAHHG